MTVLVLVEELTKPPLVVAAGVAVFSETSASSAFLTAGVAVGVKVTKGAGVAVGVGVAVTFGVVGVGVEGVLKENLGTVTPSN